MAQNTGTQIIAPIVTPDSADVFPTHINSMGKGGLKVVKTIAERDTIPIERREDGMLCVVIGNGTLYQLKGGTDNAFWIIFATGTGGATTASDLIVTPAGGLTSTNVQSALEELDGEKASLSHVYSKTETEAKIASFQPSYENILNKPDLSTLHNHTNKTAIDKFVETGGQITWSGKNLGDMSKSVYDKNNNGIVDKAETLEGMTATIAQVNALVGVTSNVQSQINALSSGIQFKGEYSSYTAMLGAIPSGQKGYWVFITVDETHNNSKTQYYHDGTNWIYGGGASAPPPATASAQGAIKLQGDLSHPDGTADAPKLSLTTVVPGTYAGANLTIGPDGRVTFAENGSMPYARDDEVSTKDTWSSKKISDAFSAKSDKTHTHSQLHDSNIVGGAVVDMTNMNNGKVMSYDSLSGTIKWVDPAGGKFRVGSRIINGEVTFVAGSFMSLAIDEDNKTITFNSTASAEGGGGGGVPALTEITSTIVVPAGSFINIDLDATYNKYDIRTLEATSVQGTLIDVAIFDSSGNTRRRIYLTNKDTYIYDIVNVPCHDKDESKKLHLVINNYGITDTTVKLIINTTNLS